MDANIYDAFFISLFSMTIFKQNTVTKKLHNAAKNSLTNSK